MPVFFSREGEGPNNPDERKVRVQRRFAAFETVKAFLCAPREFSKAKQIGLSWANTQAVLSPHVQMQEQMYLSRTLRLTNLTGDGVGWNVGWQPSHGKLD